MNFNDETFNDISYPRNHGTVACTPQRGKTALVLAGGGITGAVYEIGALRAVNDILVNHTVNDFDIYVGTSAGSLVAAMLANGMTPQEMMQAIGNNHPEIRAIRSDDIFQSNKKEFLTRLTRLPRTLLRGGKNLLNRANEKSLTELLWEFADLLPTGFYSGDALESYVQEVLSRPGCLNRFDALAKELYIIATDLDSGERAVFGKGGKGIVPISKAVAASSAIPIIYKPVRIYGKEYVDGSMRGTASLDLAVESGADLVVCINPLVPLDAQQLYGKDEHIGDEGIRTIVNQVIRIVMHAGLRYHIKSLHRQYPNVDFLLIEPRADDQKMFGYNLMDYHNRMRAANHGFQSVTEGLSERYDYFQRVLARHHIEIRDRSAPELQESAYNHYNPETLFGAEPTADDQTQHRLADAIQSLESTLGHLDEMLNRSG